MLILRKAGSGENGQGDSLVAIFGIGLIGTHLFRNLVRHHYQALRNFPFSWHDSFLRKKEKADILNYIRLYNRTDPLCRIDFVWSAGKGGFDMELSDTQPEMDSFSEVVEMTVAMAKEYPSCPVRFHMISSAGGLYEGQRNVTITSQPAPRRPYAFLKLAQEKFLSDCDEVIRCVYRLTSVYGFAGLNHRFGLIPTLLWNGSKNKVSTIFGTPDTLRDYVWANDVGAFIASRILITAFSPETYILASGKPTSLFEIIKHTEKALNRKIFCHYIKSGSNTEHNTFNITTNPEGWRPFSLETGVLKTFHSMVSNSAYVQ